MNQNKLFQHLIEDASFYYEQRKHLLNRSDFFWKDIENTEKRLEAAIKSFFPEKNRKAVDFCSSIKDFCDPGELFVALSIFVRSKNYEEISSILEDSTFLEDKERYEAIVDALKNELPDNQISVFIEKMVENQNYIPVVLDLCGYRRIVIDSDKLDFIIGTKKYTGKLVWYLGRVKQYSADFSEIIKTEDPELFQKSAIAVMRLKNESLNEELNNELHKKEWAVLLKSISAEEEFKDEIISSYKEQKTENTILSLALSGYKKYVPELIELLELEELKEVCSLALYILTGAGIKEEVFVYEEIDRDTLFDDEKERLDNGEEPYKEGDKPGEKVTRISQNPINWRKWWDDNKSRFYDNVRYRLGRSLSKKVLIEMLESNLPIQIRQIAYEELSIHFDVDVIFETDMFVKDQVKAIGMIGV